MVYIPVAWVVCASMFLRIALLSVVDVGRDCAFVGGRCSGERGGGGVGDVYMGCALAVKVFGGVVCCFSVSA